MKNLLLKSGCGVLVAAAATLAPMGSAQAADIYEFAFKPAETLSASPKPAENIPPRTVQKVLSWEFVTYESPRGAAGPMRTEADAAAERDLKRALGGFGGEGTH